MPSDRALRRYRKLYARLLRLYPEAFRARFAESMEQSFHDLCRERRDAEERVFPFVLGLLAETTAGIFRERLELMKGLWKRLARVALGTAVILAIPLVAMRFTEEVAWTRSDFVVAGVLLFGAGILIELGASRTGSSLYRIATGLAVATGLLLIWMNLAVGLIGSENNPANLLYLAVLVVGAAGAVLARFQPRGMSRAALTMAITQALVPVVALAIWRPAVSGGEELSGMIGVFVVNTIFVALFVASALLFRRAATPLGRSST